jgi:hypothetical protein
MPTYTKTTWVNDQAPAINDTNLNNIESGIDNLYNEFDANTILKADVDNTPIKLAVAASRILGRKSTGGIDALTAAEAKALLAIAIADISDIPGTCASILTDHNKATHDALGIAPASHSYEKHTNRTRYIWLDANGGSGTCDFGVSGAQNYTRVALFDPSTPQHLGWITKLQENLVSLDHVYIVYIDFCAFTNDIVWDCYLSYGAENETVTSTTDITNVLGITTGGQTKKLEASGLSIGSIDKNDYVNVILERDADHASDNQVGDWEVKGILLEYTADE